MKKQIANFVKTKFSQGFVVRIDSKYVQTRKPKKLSASYSLLKTYQTLDQYSIGKAKLQKQIDKYFSILTIYSMSFLFEMKMELLTDSVWTIQNVFRIEKSWNVFLFRIFYF